MKVGILGGSFDPPHIGHVWAAMQAKEDHGLDRVLMVPSWSCSFYKKNGNTHPLTRLHMLQMHLYEYYKYCIYDCSLAIHNKIRYSYILCRIMKKEFPNDEMSLILGSDWDISKFKKHEKINIPIIKIDRPGQAVGFNLSSTIIRDRVRRGLPITGLVSKNVEDYIKKEGLYGCKVNS